MSEKAGGCILVIGGGISGLTAAIEAAEAGYNVYLVEKRPYLGGRVIQMNKYFPKLCPPQCGFEINIRRLRDSKKVRVFTNAEVVEVSGQPGNFDVTVKINPRYVTDACTACGECVNACPAERPDEFNYGLSTTKAIYLPHDMAFPFKYVIDREYCQEGCSACVNACKYKAIDLNEQPKTMNLKVGAIVVATGWKPYDAKKLTNLLPDHPNVITNVQFERLASISGPTKGKILRPSDGKEVESVAFVQCAGSRDENHLPYCSAICCLASLKQTTYIKEQNPDAKVFMFYIDVRAYGRFEAFLTKVKDMGIELVKGKVAKITDAGDGDLIVEAEDTETGVKRKEKVNLVVLATGMQPSDVPGLEKDEYGFVVEKDGIFTAGCAKKPSDVASSVEDATGAALKAIQVLRR